MRHALLITTVLVAAGCASTQPSRFYTLTPAASGTAATPATSELSIAVGPVSIPVAVDRPQMVLTVNANQVRFDEFNRWASPLGNNIARVVAQNLVTMLGTPRVAMSSLVLSGAGVDYRAAIEVQRFDSAPGDAATFDAVWTVSRDANGRSRTGRTTAREAASDGGYDALAAAHSRAVARLSQDIADAVRALQR